MDAPPHRILWNRERRIFFLQAHDRVAFLAKPRKISAVDPLPLQEFHRGHRLGADEEEIEPARNFIIALRKCVRVVGRSVGRAAPDDAMDVHIREHRHLGIARVHPAHVAAERRLLAVRIVGIVEVVVPLRVLAKRGVVLDRRERQWRAAAPTANELRRQQLTFFVGLTHCLAGIG